MPREGDYKLATSCGIKKRVLSLKEVVKRLNKLREARYSVSHPVRAVHEFHKGATVVGASIDVRASQWRG